MRTGSDREEWNETELDIAHLNDIIEEKNVLTTILEIAMKMLKKNAITTTLKKAMKMIERGIFSVTVFIKTVVILLLAVNPLIQSASP